MEYLRDIKNVEIIRHFPTIPECMDWHRDFIATELPKGSFNLELEIKEDNFYRMAFEVSGLSYSVKLSWSERLAPYVHNESAR